MKLAAFKLPGGSNQISYLDEDTGQMMIEYYKYTRMSEFVEIEFPPFPLEVVGQLKQLDAAEQELRTQFQRKLNEIAEARAAGDAEVAIVKRYSVFGASGYAAESDVGDFVRFQDMQTEVADMEHTIKLLRDELTVAMLERDAQKGLLTKAVEVIEWKSLYQKAEMGWYAEALVSEIKGEPVSDTGWHGQQWYAHLRSIIPPHGGSGDL